MKSPVLSPLLAIMAVAIPAVTADAPADDPEHQAELPVASVADRYSRLSDADYRSVADGLGVSVACIKAVVEIETGNCGQGFGPDSLPIINFDVNMFRKYAVRRGIKPAQYHGSHAVVFGKPDVRRYGSQQAAQYARLNAAMDIDSVAAMEGTFWGMFQIGGFNWRLCGCDSVQQFVERMSYSERAQLELFAAYVKARRLDRFLVRHDWAAFALRYNGPGFRKMNYDVRLAAAFRRHSNRQQAEK
ncbi:MAG: N-acetylmuramidase family protein [Muribaculaceae bacterium]|nr:N-acetylmuramidase family protein [Muribaculaceae bacterium]